MTRADYELPWLPAFPTTIRDRTDPRRWRYLYLRAGTALEYADDAVADLTDALINAGLRYVGVLNMLNGRPDWEDGFALRFQAEKGPDELAAELEPALCSFDAWAIHDGRGAWEESLSGGLLSRYFRENPESAAGESGYAQVFMIFNRNDRDIDTTADRIRSCFRSSLLPVFHLRGGRIFFLNANEPCSLILRRCEMQDHRLFKLSVCDSAGDTASAAVRDSLRLWQWVDLAAVPWSD